MTAPTRVLCRLPSPRADQRVRIALLADLHLTESARNTAKQLHRARTHFDRATASLDESPPEAVYILGDVYHATGEPPKDRFEEACTALDAPVTLIPGNHDLAADAFHERCAARAYPRVETHHGVRIGCLDTTARGDGAVPNGLDIALTHYPLSATLEANRQRCRAIDPGVETLEITRSAEAAETVLARDPPALVVSAHLHVPLLSYSESWVEVSAPPLCTYPQGYLELEIDSAGTVLSFVPVADAPEMARARHARADHSTTDAVLSAVSAWTLAETIRTI